MLTRRGFAGLVAGCAICEITATGFLATDASAQQAPAATPGLNRKLLSRMDGPMAGYETVTMEVEIEANVMVGRHTHPGIEMGYTLEGDAVLSVEGQPDLKMTPGVTYSVPPGAIHGAKNTGDKPIKIVATFVVEKDKPLATPAP